MSKKAATPEIVDDKPIFRPLTRESLKDLNAQIKRTQTRRHEIKCQKGLSDETENLSANPQLEAFKTLPIPLQRKFPKVLTSTPIHEIDSYYTEMEISTFVVINKNFDIWRFNTMSSLYMLTPFNPLRRVAIYILTHPYFSFFVIATILINCALMTLPSIGPIANIVERTEDGWNWLDFIVIVVAYITMFAKDLGNLSALRTFRVLRALKTVAIIPGLKTIVGAVIESVKNLKDVIVLTCFSLSLFALLGLQIYSGVLTQICIKNGPGNMTYEKWFAWHNDTSNHNVTGDEQQDLCSNSTDGQKCKGNNTCMAGFHSSPNWGFTNFDAFHFALLSAFRLLTQDAWESLYQMIIRTTGYWQILFFVTAIFFGSIYLVNLILAIVAMSYNELRKKVKAEEEAVKAEALAYQESLKLAEQNEKNSTPIINGHSLSPSDTITSQLYSLHSGSDLKLAIPNPARKLKPLTRAASTGDYEDNRELERDVKYLDSFSLPDAGAVDNYDNHYTNSESVISGWNRRNNLQVFSNYQNDSQRISATTNGRRRNSVWALHGLYNSKDDKESELTKFNGITDPNNPFILQPSELAKLRRKSETKANGYAKPEKPSLKSRIKEKFKKDLNRAVDMFCIWDCCWCWVWVQKITSNIVFDPFMELFITICIVVNTLFMAMDSNEAEFTEFGRVLNGGNTFFTTAFTLEACLKLIALNPKFYFREGWNCFDFLIVSLSLLEKAFEGVSGFSVLRTFR
ncbi:voltage-gated sodium channel-like protein, partial [Leptotrombidium deliense]